MSSGILTDLEGKIELSYAWGFGMSSNNQAEAYSLLHGIRLVVIAQIQILSVVVTPCFPQFVKITILTKNYGELRNVNV